MKKNLAEICQLSILNYLLKIEKFQANYVWQIPRDEQISCSWRLVFIFLIVLSPDLGPQPGPGNLTAHFQRYWRLSHNWPRGGDCVITNNWAKRGFRLDKKHVQVIFQFVLLSTTGLFGHWCPTITEGRCWVDVSLCQWAMSLFPLPWTVSLSCPGSCLVTASHQPSLNAQIVTGIWVVTRVTPVTGRVTPSVTVTLTITGIIYPHIISYPCHFIGVDSVRLWAVRGGGDECS